MRYTFPLLVFLFTAHNLWASPAEEPKEFNIPILDSAQDLLGNRANFAANNFDSFFATERADDEFGRSRLRVRTSYNIRERALPEVKTQYRLNLRLPHLEDKFKFSYFEKDPKDKDTKKPTTEEIKKKVNINQLNIGWIFNADASFALALPPRVTTRARVRKNFDTGTIIHRFAEQFTYITTESGIQEETTLTSDQGITDDLLFRFINSKRWRFQSKEFITTHGPVLLHRITDKDAFSYSLATATAVIEKQWAVHNYGMSVTYRRNLYKNWIYSDFITGLDFPRIWDWRRTPFVTFQLEFLFGS
ncbi:MAG TPA: hypothetical protein VNJ01_17365 [Bacteriovoracaceae bacterium]|nr:hypothetical protein [Bacteriovoracaceae bacterium]